MKKLIGALSITALILFLTILYNALAMGGSFQAIKKSGENIQANILRTPKKEESISYNERIQKGDTLFENGYTSLAIKEYTEAQKISPEKSEPYLRIGKVHLHAKNIEKAEENFKKALTLDANNTDITVQLGKILIIKNNFQEAKTLFENISLQNQIVQYYQGILQLFFLETDQAKKNLEAALLINTTEAISNNIQKFLEALATYEKAKDSDKVYLQALLTKVFNEVEEYDLAKTLAVETLKNKNDYRDVWILLGYACLKKEDYTCSIDALQGAYKLDSEKAETQYFLGLAYFGNDDLKNAIKYLELARENGFEPKVQVNQKLAEIYLLNKDYENAVENYESVVSEYPEEIESFIRPVWIYIEHLMEPDKALALAQEAISKHPESAMSYNLLGWAYIAKKEFEKAEENLEKALEMDPNLAAAYLNFGQLAEAKGNVEKAENYYQTAYQLAEGEAVGNLAAEKYNNLIQKNL